MGEGSLAEQVAISDWRSFVRSSLSYVGSGGVCIDCTRGCRPIMANSLPFVTTPSALKRLFMDIEGSLRRAWVPTDKVLRYRRWT